MSWESFFACCSVKQILIIWKILVFPCRQQLENTYCDGRYFIHHTQKLLFPIVYLIHAAIVHLSRFPTQSLNCYQAIISMRGMFLVNICKAITLSSCKDQCKIHFNSFDKESVLYSGHFDWPVSPCSPLNMPYPNLHPGFAKPASCPPQLSHCIGKTSLNGWSSCFHWNPKSSAPVETTVWQTTPQNLGFRFFMPKFTTLL